MAGQDLLTNPVFGFVFVWVWVGLVPISPARRTGGRPTRWHHPRRAEPAGRHGPGAGPAAAARADWGLPAALALFGFAWLELVQAGRTRLAALRVWALAWLVLGVIGAIVFGRR